MSAQVQREWKDYDDILERTRKSTLDVTERLEWFPGCAWIELSRTQSALAAVFMKDRFWKTHAAVSMNEGQRLMLNRLLDGFEGKLPSTKWATIAKCSQDTAQRDIVDLIAHGILGRDEAGGRSTSYSFKSS
jgi:Fic family protein